MPNGFDEGVPERESRRNSTFGPSGVCTNLRIAEDPARTSVRQLGFEFEKRVVLGEA